MYLFWVPLAVATQNHLVFLGSMVFKNASVLKLIVMRLYLQNQCMQLMTSAAIAN